MFSPKLVRLFCTERYHKTYMLSQTSLEPKHVSHFYEEKLTIFSVHVFIENSTRNKWPGVFPKASSSTVPPDRHDRPALLMNGQATTRLASPHSHTQSHLGLAWALHSLHVRRRVTRPLRRVCVPPGRLVRSRHEN